MPSSGKGSRARSASEISQSKSPEYTHSAVFIRSGERDIIRREQVKIDAPDQAVQPAAKIGDSKGRLPTQFAFDRNVVLLNPWRCRLNGIKLADGTVLAASKEPPLMGVCPAGSASRPPARGEPTPGPTSTSLVERNGAHGVTYSLSCGGGIKKTIPAAQTVLSTMRQAIPTRGAIVVLISVE